MDKHPEALTRAIELTTNVPFPTSGHELSAECLDDQKIALTICSELLQYTAPISTFDGQGKLGLITDLNGQPIVFSVGTDHKLYMLSEVDGAKQGWQVFDITPCEGDKITVFDVFEDSTKHVHLAVSIENSSGLSDLKYGTFALPRIEFNPDTGRIEGFSPQTSITWVSIANSEGQKKVSYLALGPTDSSAKVKITAGSHEQTDIAATFYTIDPSPESQKPWMVAAFPEDASEILEIQPAKVRSGSGHFTLYRRVARDIGLDLKGEPDVGCLVQLLDPTTGELIAPLRILTAEIGQIRSISSSLNPWNYTDLLAASEKGIGFYDHAKPTDKPLVILPDISFKQVVCSEAVDPKNPTTQSLLTIFGVSDGGELYFVQGTRQFKGNKMSFAHSGFPLREGVSRLSCQYNSLANASELVYLGTGKNEVKHLSRDPITTCWNEETLCFQATTKTTTYPAYITTIGVSSESGSTIARDFKLHITSEPMMVTANDRSYYLNRKPSTIACNSSGQITIVTPVDDLLGAPVFNVKVENAGVSQMVKVHAAQRVLRILSKVKDAKDISGAVSTNGQPIFSSSSSDSRKESFQESAELLSNFGSMVHTIDPGAKDMVSITPTASQDLSIGVKKENKSWLENAATNVGEFLGDMLEMIKRGIKTGLKVVFRIIGPVIKIFLKIAGKVVEAVVKTVGPLLRAVSSFLKDSLGIDLGKIMEWLGFGFGVGKTKKTQVVLNNLARAVRQKSTAFISRNGRTINDGIEELRNYLLPYVQDSRPAPQVNGKPDSLKSSPLRWLFDNPILKFIMKFNPLTIILEAAGEAFDESELADMFEGPSLAPLLSIFTEILPKLMDEQLGIFFRLIEDLQEKATQFARNSGGFLDQVKSLMGDAMWTMFDSLKSILMTIWEIFGKVIEQVFELAMGTWKIPLITSVWEWFAEQEFSIMNVLTFVGATILNILFPSGKDQTAWDILGRPDLLIESIPDECFDLREFLNIVPPQPVAPRVLKKTGIFANMKSHQLVSGHQQTGAPPGFMMLAAAIPSDSLAAVSTSSNNEEEMKLKEYKHLYNTTREWCTILSSVFRVCAVGVEAWSTWSEADEIKVDASKGKKVYMVGDEIKVDTSKREQVPLVGRATSEGGGKLGRVVAVTSASFATGARLVSVGMLLYCRSKSKKFKEEVDKHATVYIVGEVGTIFCSSAGLIAHAYHLQGKYSVMIQSSANLLLSSASFFDLILLHLAADWNESDKKAKDLRIADSVEIGANVSGVIAIILSVLSHKNKDPEVKYSLAAGAVAAHLVDGLGTILPGIITACNMGEEEEHHTK